MMTMFECSMEYNCDCGKKFLLTGKNIGEFERFLKAHSLCGIEIPCPNCNKKLSLKQKPDKCPKCGAKIKWG